MPRMRWRPGLRPGSRWVSTRRSPRHRSRLGSGTPPPQEHTPRRLDPRACSARCSAHSVPRFWRIPTYIFSNTPLGEGRLTFILLMHSWNRAANWLRPALGTRSK